MKKTFKPIQLNIYYFDDVDVITGSRDPYEGPLMPAGFFESIFWQL